MVYRNEYLKKKNRSDDGVKTFNEFLNSINIKSSLILGDFFMTILQQFPHDIFYREYMNNSFYTRDPFNLKINNEFIDELKQNLIINPNTLPMICEPKVWNNNSYGGFITNESRALDIITGSEYFAHKVINKDSIYKAVNYLNSIKFKINKNLLDYLFSGEGSYILESVKPDDELQRHITLKVAQIYKDTYFYLNTRADWRGRLYTQSFYISYQSGDLSTALLNFYKGAPITAEGKFYLYIYGANNHNINGLSKESFDVRLKWVKDNYEKIINQDKELILSAENPFTFTAFCLNMKEIHNNPEAIIYTPVFLDATCSGIQHFAGLLKDLELGTNTNLLISTTKERPNDVYTYLLDPINSEINKLGENDPNYSTLSLVKLSRREVKRAIMTKVYNVTIYGISHQLQDLFKTVFEKDSNISSDQNLNSFDDKLSLESIKTVEADLKKDIKNKDTIYICPGRYSRTVRITSKDIYKIAEIIDKQIFVVFPSLNEIYNYFFLFQKLQLNLEFL